MKKLTEKRLSLGKIKIASFSKGHAEGAKLVATLLCTFKACPDDMSQGAPRCSVDSCRF
ncbi:MAG TPA: hypothetical protein VM802_09815 [Chitinophaga sp.]|uniref:hypothetical protein n=1 Tax=Chitinophaga sp. TaxID=1869181 RepID=UPI002BCB1E96|nr:hypothetical protein [Chitinophaga sp.]HVI45159.1 hypothetical protein [Chitinophaga sp.]